MNIHEYQGKSILRKYGVATPVGHIIENLSQAKDIIKQVQSESGSEKVVVKAQIHAGGRGKGGGVKLADNLEQALEHADNILGMQLVTHQTGPEGKKVHKILVEENVYYPGEEEPKEYYMSILLDRNTSKLVIMASTEGGMDIEEVAEKTPEKIVKEWIDPSVGLQGFQARKVAFGLGLTGKAFKGAVKFIYALYQAYVESDAALVEINPMLKTSDGRILAADCKLGLDDTRHYHPSQAYSLRPRYAHPKFST